MLLLGAGPRALLMQIAHPLVAEGVDQHSFFQDDPWARLRGTVTSYLTVVYGSTSAARAEIRRLNALHRGIRGPVRDAGAAGRFGGSYSARDPELTFWVHATLIESTLVCYDAWFERLSADERARAYAETLPIARAFGVPDSLIPPDYAGFEAYLATMLTAGGPIAPTATARELAQTILHPRLGHVIDFLPNVLRPPLATVLDLVPPAVYDWSLWPSVGLLPEGVRAGYGIEWGPLQKAVSAWLVGVWRVGRPFMPPSLRWMEASRRADRRVARAG
jgi:uncharacterized protein (DUF2236 family)